MTSFTDIKKTPANDRVDANGVFKKITSSLGASGSGRIHMLPTDSIYPSPNQPRKSFDDSSLIKLADSIRKYGILHPITVRSMECSNSEKQCYEIIMGERRFRAALLLKLETVPCIIIRSDSRRCAEIAIVENIQREDLNFFDQATAIASLIDIYHLTQEQVANRLSVSQSFIANKLRLLRFSESERDKILTYSLSERHARALLRIDSSEKRMRAIEYIHKSSLNVTTTESYINRLLTEPDGQCHAPGSKRLILKDIRVFYNTIDKAVSIVKQAGIEIVSERVDGEDGSATLTIRIPRTRDVSRETFSSHGS